MDFKQALQTIDLHLRHGKEITPENMAEATAIIGSVAYAPIDFSVVDALLRKNKESIHEFVREAIKQDKTI